MSRSASNPEPRSQGGFTLLEILVAAAVSVLVGVIAHRFYRDSYRAYSAQEQIEERNQNANFTLGKMVEIMQQAGAGLPDSGWSPLNHSGGVLTLGSNHGGVVYFVGDNPPNSKSIGVDDVGPLRSQTQPLWTSTHILVDSVGSKGVGKFAIDTNYNQNGYAKGLKNLANGRDSVRLTSWVNLATGDMVYGYREDQYLLLNDSLMIRPNGNSSMQVVLAENIDSLGFTFRNTAGNSVSAWKDMRSVSIHVRARTSKSDPRLPPPGYQKISLPMNVILRNKV